MMSTEIKKKNIDKIVKIFKESLEKTYLDNDTKLYDVGINPLNNIFIGKINLSRLKNGNLKLSGQLPKVMFKEECKGLPLKFDDYKIYPLVVTLFHYPEGENRK